MHPLCHLHHRCLLLFRVFSPVVAVAAGWTCGYVVFVPVVVAALVAFFTSWRSLLPREAWEEPTIVGVNRLATHSRLGNYPTFEEAASRGQSPNVVSLRCGRVVLPCGTCLCEYGRKHARGVQSSMVGAVCSCRSDLAFTCVVRRCCTVRTRKDLVVRADSNGQPWLLTRLKGKGGLRNLLFTRGRYTVS